MNNFYISDFETTSKMDLLCASIYFPELERCKTYDNLNEYFCEIFRNCTNSIIYFHFGGGFDFLYLLSYISDNNDYQLVDFIEVGGLIFKMEISDGNNIIEFRDSWALFRQPLDKVCKSLLNEKQKSKDLEKWHLKV